MPANKKYLSSPLQRFLKITAGFIGGYGVMMAFHLLLTVFVDKKHIVMTAGVTGYILWAFLLLLALLSKNGWKIWGLYLFIFILLAGPYLLIN